MKAMRYLVVILGEKIYKNPVTVKILLNLELHTHTQKKTPTVQLQQPLTSQQALGTPNILRLIH